MKNLFLSFFSRDNKFISNNICCFLVNGELLFRQLGIRISFCEKDDWLSITVEETLLKDGFCV